MKPANHSAFWLESKRIVTLALPILVSQLAQTGNGFVDTIMSGHVGSVDLAAVAVGSSIWVPIYLFFVGVMLGLSPFVSQLHGGHRLKEVGPLVQQGLWLALPLGCCGFLAMRNVEPLLDMMQVDNQVKPLIVAYLKGLSWGFPAITLFLALRFFTEGLSRTRPVMVVSVVGLAVNIPVNYALIYGKLGLPALGGVGCGWATSIVMWLMLILMAGYCWFQDGALQSQLFQRLTRPNLKTMVDIVKVGLPIGLAIFAEVSLFAVVALLIAGISAEVVAGHQIALSAASMTFMVPLSLSLALTIRVGNSMGISEAREKKLALQTSVICGLFIVVVMALVNSSVIATLRQPIASLYTQDMAVIALASELLLFAAVFQLSDGLQVGANGVLRGMKDTTIPMYITVIAYWCVGLPLGYTLGLTSWLTPAQGAHGFWYGLVAGLTAAAILLCWRVWLRVKSLKPN